MLVLKRSSDVFDAEREKIVGSRIEQGMAQEKAKGYGEDPDYYDGFFVPERARWAYLQDKLGDAKEPYGSVLDKALGALAEHNDTLEHVLDHISFMRVQSNKRNVSDDACKDLVGHFSKYRLRNEDFQFSDLRAPPMSSSSICSPSRPVRRAETFTRRAMLSASWSVFSSPSRA